MVIDSRVADRSVVRGFVCFGAGHRRSRCGSSGRLYQPIHRGHRVLNLGSVCIVGPAWSVGSVTDYDNSVAKPRTKRCLGSFSPDADTGELEVVGDEYDEPT
jgi:hypothetical protein